MYDEQIGRVVVEVKRPPSLTAAEAVRVVSSAQKTATAVVEHGKNAASVMENQRLAVELGIASQGTVNAFNEAVVSSVNAKERAKSST